MKPTITNYQEASHYLGQRQTKKLDKTTTIYKHEEHIAIKHHNTDIIVYTKHKKTIRLNTQANWTITQPTTRAYNCYRTVTTKKRLNQYTKLRITQKNYEWYIQITKHSKIDKTLNLPPQIQLTPFIDQKPIRQ